MIANGGHAKMSCLNYRDPNWIQPQGVKVMLRAETFQKLKTTGLFQITSIGQQKDVVPDAGDFPTLSEIETKSKRT